MRSTLHCAGDTILLLITITFISALPALHASAGSEPTRNHELQHRQRGPRQSRPCTSSSRLVWPLRRRCDATSLYEYINRDKVWGANLDPPESAKHVIKPWDQRLTAEPSTQSNVDDQIAITVPFTCPVRLKSILINTGTGDFAPTAAAPLSTVPDGVDSTM